MRVVLGIECTIQFMVDLCNMQLQFHIYVHVKDYILYHAMIININMQKGLKGTLSPLLLVNSFTFFRVVNSFTELRHNCKVHMLI